MSDVPKLKPGQSVGGWTVQGEPARGGNARVYKVSDQAGRVGALKQLWRTTDESEGRFQREIAAVKQLPPHPHLTSILDAAPANSDAPWYVMTWVEGPTLADDRARFAGQLEPSLAIVGKLAQAADALHKHGIIHRDVKPDNVLIRASDDPLLSDLGLCWLTNFSTARLTPDDRPTGAWGFRAPEHEHARVEDVNASADVFSLVKILWWLIDGGPPFAAAHFEGDQFDLARKYNDVRMHAVRTLMSRVITADPTRRTITTGGQLVAELSKIGEQLKSPTSGRLSAAVGARVAQRQRSETAMTDHREYTRRMEEDFPKLRQRWRDALDPVVAEVSRGFTEGARPVQVAVIDQQGNHHQQQPNGLGMAIGHMQVFIQFKTASGSTGGIVVFEITTQVRLNGRDAPQVARRIGLPPKLDRRMAGDESFFIVQGDTSEAPLDPAVFWEHLAMKLVAIA